MRAAISAALSLLLCVSTMSAQNEEPKPKIPNQYKRIHAQALSQILDGRVERAISTLEYHSKQQPTDPETRFMLAVAYARDGRAADALEAAREAIELGLPPERFVAGPRDLFASLREHPEFREISARASDVLHGPMIGTVTGGLGTRVD